MRKVLLAILLVLLVAWQVQARISRMPDQKPIHGSQIDWKHPITKGLVLHLLMNERSGNKTYDLSGKENNGTIIGAAWRANGLEFDGVDDYVLVNDANSLDITGPITISFWAKPSSTASNAGGWMDKYAAYAIRYYVSGSQKLNVVLWGTATTKQVASSASGLLPVGQWTHFTMTYDLSNVKQYFNGALDTASVIAFTESLKTSAQNLSIMRTLTDANHLNGTIDEVAIWNRSLSAAEIKKLYEDPYCFIKKPQNMALRWLGIPAAAPPAGGGGVPTQIIGPIVTQWICDEVYAGSLAYA